MGKLTSRHTNPSIAAKARTDYDRKSVSLEQLSLAFVILAVALAFAFLIFMIEQLPLGRRIDIQGLHFHGSSP